MTNRKSKTEIKGPGGEIILYRTKDGRVALDVRLERETLWLSQKQMSALFDKDTDTIGLHIRNVFEDGELGEPATTEECSVVQNEGGRPVRRPVRFYNLDVIISVGYRVKSQRGTQFRIWATQVLKDHILHGYTLNERRLQAQVSRIKELQHAVDLMGRIISERTVTGVEADGLLKVISGYSLALRLLDQYDRQQLRLHATTEIGRFILTYDAAVSAIARMAQNIGPQANSLVGLEKRTGDWKARSEPSTRPSAATIFTLDSWCYLTSLLNMRRVRFTHSSPCKSSPSPGPMKSFTRSMI